MVDGFPGGSLIKKRIRLQCRRRRSDLWVGKMPWRRAWQPTLAPLPGESHGQRSLMGYSPWGRRGLDTNEMTSSCTHIAEQVVEGDFKLRL